MKNYTISVNLGSEVEPITHQSDQGYGTTTDGQLDQWREVYCHDDDCGWMVSAPAADFVLVACVPNEPAEEPTTGQEPDA